MTKARVKDNIVAVIMGQDHADFLKLALKSVKDADKIVYIDGGSKDKSCQIARKAGAEVLINKYNQNDPKMNGKQRNTYLKHLKANHLDWWCVVLDADEIVHDFQTIRDSIYDYKSKFNVITPRMRHLLYSFGGEDSTTAVQHVRRRIFKVSNYLEYPEAEHVYLQGEGIRECTDENIVFWHLAYSRMFHIRDRHRKNLKHSNIHNKAFLDWWYRAHLFGRYPMSPVDSQELPSFLLDEFDISQDELYFENRGLEVKHFIDSIHWRDEFKPERVLLVGCGRGPRVYALRQLGVRARGLELNEWAVKHSFLPEFISQGDICRRSEINRVVPCDLVVAYDVLEHIDYHRIGKAVENLVYVCSKYILVSVPFVGNPDLENDKTHRIFEDREWWVRLFKGHGVDELSVPEHFQYRDQLLLFKVKK